MHLVVQGGLRYYQFTALSNLRHAIFTRHGGVSQAPFDSLNVGGMVGDDLGAVRRNHTIMYEALHVEPRRAVTTWLVHGVDVVYVTGPVQGRLWAAQADAMMTDKPDTPLVMRYADCTPLFFHDPVKGVVALAHAGWRGTVAGMAARTIKAMGAAFGSRPADVLAGIGPAIGPARYQVGEEVVAAVHAYFGTLDGLIRRDPVDGSAYFDLWEANRRDLLGAGVEQVELAGLCTAENTDQFYSHRAEGGRTGRFGAVLSL
ncbi:peptidoglycan editing factor PgeF [bacterium]|nr:peptidoglycan editing factor PgeF [bacterium]